MHVFVFQIVEGNRPTLDPCRSDQPNRYDWLNDFLVQGRNGQDKERDGAIVYLSQDLKTELGRINLFSCGIFGLEPVKAEAGSESIRRVAADLYCERMQLQVPKS
ncbi:MAG TPA: hypothetical protein VGN76_02780 [Gemmatimonadales bacterium]|nr:hypothetical protein [Gemmatimonadales bacterium]